MNATASPTTPTGRRAEPVPPVLAAMPKVELHLHLDCCVSFRTAARLVPGLSEREYRDEFIAPARCRSFAEWVTRVEPALALLQTVVGLRLVTADLFRQLAADGVVYAEVRFAPLLHTRGGLTPEEVVGTVEAATEEAIRETGVEARLILCTLRHFSAADSVRTAKLAAARGGSLVVGLDIAGDEANFPLEPHVAAFALATDLGIARTAHAGEGAGAQSVRETLDRLAPSRIGHGVRSIEDPALVARLARDGTHLEICPGSNEQTGVLATGAVHPIDRLYRTGVSVGISTDARAVVDTTLSEEYARVTRVHGWSIAELRRCNEAALAAAFLPDAVRHRIKPRLGSPLAEDELPPSRLPDDEHA